MAKTAVKTEVKAAIKQKTTEKAPDDNFSKAKKCLEAIGESWYTFAVAVANIYDNEEYKDKYPKFDDCAKAEWGMAYRTAMNNVQVGQTIKKRNLTRDALAETGINWTNFMEISATFKPDMTESQVMSRIKKAAKMTHDEVVKFKQSIMHGGADGEHPITFNTMVFKLKPEAAQVVQHTLSTAKELMDTPFDDAAIEYICLDWMNEHDPEKVDEIKKKLVSDLEEDEAPKARPKGEARKERADKGKPKGKAKAEPKAEKKATKKAKAEPEADEDDDDLLGD